MLSCHDAFISAPSIVLITVFLHSFFSNFKKKKVITFTTPKFGEVTKKYDDLDTTNKVLWATHHAHAPCKAHSLYSDIQIGYQLFL